MYAFEPVTDVCGYIENAARVYPNIELCKYALSSYSGKAKFSANNIYNYSNKLVSTDSEMNVAERDMEEQEVDVITIDEFVESHEINRVDYIKADIEGAEREMLLGAKKTLQKFGPKLSICEYHLPDDPEVLEKIILDANPQYIIRHKYMKLYAYIPQND